LNKNNEKHHVENKNIIKNITWKLKINLKKPHQQISLVKLNVLTLQFDCTFCKFEKLIVLLSQILEFSMNISSIKRTKREK